MIILTNLLFKIYLDYEIFADELNKFVLGLSFIFIYIYIIYIITRDCET